MSEVNTTWKFSSATESERVLQALSQVINRFYQKNDFLVLPYLVERDAATVYIPDLDFSEIKDYFPILSKLKLDIPLAVDSEVLQKIENVLDKKNLSEIENDIERLKSEWENVAEEFWKVVIQLLPELSDKKLNLEVRLTRFGTVSSFSRVIRKRDCFNIKVYIRLDFTAAQIAEGILSSILLRGAKTQDDFWENQEPIIDFLFTSTGLARLFPEYVPTIKSVTRKEKGTLLKKSHEYLLKLGFPNVSIFSINEDRILFENKELAYPLSTREEILLKFLIKNKNKFCSIEEIGHVLWKDNFFDKYSPWAVSKQVQRLRDKLSEIGLSPSIIQTMRCKGYMLND